MRCKARAAGFAFCAAIVATAPGLAEVTAADASRACDLAAANPRDTDRPAGVQGIERTRIDSAVAIQACEAALALDPANRRLLYQTGRAHYEAKDYRKARPLFDRAAQSGSAIAIVTIGWMHFQGIGGPVDDEQARSWFERAAAAGNIEGMNNLAHLYRTGRGVTRDDVMAGHWYKKSAALGNSHAMSVLGYMYMLGQGVRKDNAEARRWLSKALAADPGNTTARENLAVIDQANRRRSGTGSGGDGGVSGYQDHSPRVLPCVNASGHQSNKAYIGNGAYGPCY